MTETQAKSGAAGASTDAEDTSVETSTTPDDGGDQANVASITDPIESPTTVVRLTPGDASGAGSSADSDDSRSSGFSWPAASSASTAPPSSPGSSTAGSSKSGASYTPTPVSSSTPPVTPTPVASAVTPTPVR